MPRVTEDHRAARRRQIADAALACFRRKGFAATSMSEIIAESGLSAGAIYLHYPSKHDLIAVVAAEAMRSRWVEADALLASSPAPHPRDLVRTLVGGALAELDGDPAIVVQIWAEAVTDSVLHDLASNVLDQLRSRFHAGFLAWYVERGAPPGTARERADALTRVGLALAQGCLLQAALGSADDARALLDGLDLVDFAD